MGKKSRQKNRQATAPGEVGPRQPCPCGSGKRYKACHGGSGAAPFVARPFEGMAGECDLIALRELVPAATVPLKFKDSDRELQLCSILPGAAPALVRDSGAIWLGLQVQHNFGDPSRDLGAVLERALEAEPGDLVGLTTPPAIGARLQDLIVDEPFDVTVHDTFGFWVADQDDADEAAAALEQANAQIYPTKKLLSVPSAYWTDVGSKEHLRWARPEAEAPLLDALAILHTTGDTKLGEDTRLVGMFRAHGVLVPVWDLPVGMGAEALEEPVVELDTRLSEVLAQPRELTSDERSTREALGTRQVTIR